MSSEWDRSEPDGPTRADRDGAARKLIGLLRRLRRGPKWGLQRAAAWAAVLPLDRRPRRVSDLDAFEPRAIVATRTDRIGDLLVSSPLLAALHRRWPAARLVLVHGPKNREVLEGLPFVEAGPEFRREPSSWVAVAAWLARQHFDLAVSLRAEAMSDVYVAAWSGAPVRATTHATKTLPAYNLLLGEDIRHHLTRYCRAAAVVGAPCAQQRPVFVIPAAARRQGVEWLQTLRGSASGSLVGVQIPNRSNRRHARRAWPLDRVTAVARQLVADGARVVLRAVGSERADAERVRAAVPEAVLAPQVSLATFAAIQQGFDLFVSGYTGSWHLAEAVGTPGVVIGTPAQTACWGPLEPIHRAVVALRVPEVPVAAVLDAARSLLGRRSGRAGVPDAAGGG